MLSPEEVELFLDQGIDTGQLGHFDVGLSLRPKKILRGAGRAVKATGRATKKVAKKAVKTTVAIHTAPFKLIGKGLDLARKKLFNAFLGKLASRRARYLSYQRRRSSSPNAAEKAEARAWTRRYIKSRGPLGKLLGAVVKGDVMGEAVTTVAITASIPVLIAFLKKQLKVAEHEGAPANPATPPPEDVYQAAEVVEDEEGG